MKDMVLNDLKIRMTFNERILMTLFKNFTYKIYQCGYRTAFKNINK